MATKKKTRTKKTARRSAKTKADRIDAAAKTAAKSVAAAKQPRAKKTGALDAAVKVLGDSKRPLTTKEMIHAMAAKNLWKSARGKTPERTLYSAILREIVTKKKEARFKKTERGKFALAR